MITQWNRKIVGDSGCFCKQLKGLWSAEKKANNWPFSNNNSYKSEMQKWTLIKVLFGRNSHSECIQLGQI